MSKELLFSVTKNDLILTPIRGSGPGGQHRNKNFTGIRMEHPASGAVVEATDSKSQEQNKKSCIRKLAEHPKFKMWWRRKVWELTEKENFEKNLNERVQRAMYPDNLLVEEFKDGEWVVAT